MLSRESSRPEGTNQISRSFRLLGFSSRRQDLDCQSGWYRMVQESCDFPVVRRGTLVCCVAGGRLVSCCHRGQPHPKRSEHDFTLLLPRLQRVSDMNQTFLFRSEDCSRLRRFRIQGLGFKWEGMTIQPPATKFNHAYKT